MDIGFDALTYWHWFILGVALLVLEMVVPGVFFLWVGIAALIVGAIALVIPDLAWQVQLLCFAILAVGAAIGARVFIKKRPQESDHPTLNQRGAQYIGQAVVLETAIINGQGRAKVGDTVWAVTGEDAPVGTVVIIEGADGTILRVKKSDQEQD